MTESSPVSVTNIIMHTFHLNDFGILSLTNVHGYFALCIFEELLFTAVLQGCQESQNGFHITQPCRVNNVILKFSLCFSIIIYLSSHLFWINIYITFTSQPFILNLIHYRYLRFHV